ncbi:hypothetical protein ACFMBG_01780 [Leisingera sp. D0M16]
MSGSRCFTLVMPPVLDAHHKLIGKASRASLVSLQPARIPGRSQNPGK